MKKKILDLISFLRYNKTNVSIIFILLAIAGTAHGFNMFHYPYYENDEATYVSQAWSTIKHGQLAPYTYWYDHAPAGWIFLGIWFILTGGTHLAGSLLQSGRILMLFLHLVSCVMLYLITLKLSKRRLGAIIAVLLFSISPLGIYFQRRILLDNIMVFWVLISLYNLVIANSKLRNIALSAVAFGFAILTKENAIFFTPVFIYLIFKRNHKRSNNHALALWSGIVAGIIGMYILYALLKGELLPATVNNSGVSSHVSLIDALKTQSGRGAFHWPWQAESQFYLNTQEWIARDPIIIIGGYISIIIGIALSIKEKYLRISTSLILLLILFLARGKLVINFYVVPLLPLFAMQIGILLSLPLRFISKHRMTLVYMSFILLSIIILYSGLTTIQYNTDETTNQNLAINWVKRNLGHNESVAIDDYAYPALQDEANFKNADWFFKIQLDPEINKKYKNNYKNIHYIVLSNQMIEAMRYNEVPMIREAFDHSVLVADFSKSSSSYNDIRKLISTNGDWAQIYRLKTEPEIKLQDSWKTYKSSYVQSYGQVVNGDTTTTEGQSYAMLRSVAQNDQSTFDGLYSWMQDHMEYRKSDKLFSWKWQKVNGAWRQTDSNTATDADQDSAYALLKAYGQWHDIRYLNQAKIIINDIWGKEIVNVAGHYYVASSAAGQNSAGNLLINPSYIAPSYYKAFAKIDPSHPWNALVNDSYAFLSNLQNKTTGLVPDWTEINSEGNVIPLDITGLSNDSGYDAFRSGFRVSQDSTDFRSKEYLKPLLNFYSAEWNQNHIIKAVYELNGIPKVTYGDIAQYSAIAAILKAGGQQKVATEIMTQKIDSSYKNGSWGDPKNYYNQNWAALGLQQYIKK